MTAVVDRPVLSSERAPYIDKPATVLTVKKFGVRPQMGFGTRADGPSDHGT
jgi:hypothetical protein